MSLPESTFGVAVLIALALPGVVFAAFRTLLRGYSFSDVDLASRLSQAIAVSVVLDAAYFFTAGDRLFRGLEMTIGQTVEITVTDASAVGLNVLIYAVLIPAVLAVLVYAIRWKSFTWVRRLQGRIAGRAVVDRAPTAWDTAGATQGHVWVRVRRPDGDGKEPIWIGGWYTTGSSMSAFPTETRDIFIGQQFHMTAGGEFGRPVAKSAGVWVSINEGDIVEWISA